MIIKLAKYKKTPEYKTLKAFIENLSLEEKSVLIYMIFLYRFNNLKATRHDVLYALFHSRHSTPDVDVNYICANTVWPDIELGYRLHQEYAEDILSQQSLVRD